MELKWILIIVIILLIFLPWYIEYLGRVFERGRIKTFEKHFNKEAKHGEEEEQQEGK